MIPVYSPYFPPGSLRYAHQALDSGWVSSHGMFLFLVEEKLREFLGVKYIILTNNGTAANHLMALGLRARFPEFKRVVVPNNVYVAAWNGFLYCNYLLINTDTDLETWNMDLETHENEVYRTDISLVVHNLGNIINVPELKKKYPNRIFVEDNCEGFGGKYNGIFSGTDSFISTFSFFGNKNVTSGEGGAVVTNDYDVYKYMKTVWGQGQSDVKFIHDYLGYNYRMTNVEAAILLGQLEIYPEIKERKQFVFDLYKKYLSSVDNVFTQKIDESTEHSNWMFGIRIVGNKDYKTAEKFFSDRGVEIRPFFYSMRRHKYLAGCWKNMTNAPILEKEIIILPSFPALTKSDIKYITDTVKDYVKSLR